MKISSSIAECAIAYTLDTSQPARTNSEHVNDYNDSNHATQNGWIHKYRCMHREGNHVADKNLESKHALYKLTN
jgi:hypothetical protein